jgi:PhnB protein
MAAKPIPEGWHSVTPRLITHGASKLVDFLQAAFQATGSFRTDGPSEIRIGDSLVMVSDAGLSPSMPAWMYLYVDDIDATYRRALGAGGLSLEEPHDLFYGDRRATVRDPFGNIWQIATHKEDVPLDEIRRRATDQPRRG